MSRRWWRTLPHLGWTALSTRRSPARHREVETEFGKARGEGSSPAAIVSAAIRQVANLHKMKLAVEGGDSIEFAMKRGAPPVHFSREKDVGAALRAWTPPRLLRAMQQLAEASLDMRRNSALAEAIAQRTLLSLAVSARRREFLITNSTDNYAAPSDRRCPPSPPSRAPETACGSRRP